MRKKLLVIGNGKPAADVVGYMATLPEDIDAGWLFHGSDPRSARSARALQKKHPGVSAWSCTRIADTAGRAALRDFQPNLLLSVNNFAILTPELLASAPDGALNFHNGPLPRYRGLNIPSWAIINGEARHGVAWHYVVEGIDAGDVVARCLFDLEPRETAISLTFRCIDAAVGLLPAVIRDYLGGTLRREPQDHALATYYSRNDIPNGGFVDPAWPADRIGQFLRGLDFHPYPNSFVRPRVRLADGRVLSGERGTFEQHTTDAPPGQLLASNQDCVAISCTAGRILLLEPMAVDEP